MDGAVDMTLQERERAIAALRAEQDAARRDRRKLEDTRLAERRANDDRRRKADNGEAERRSAEDVELRTLRAEEDRHLQQLRRSSDEARMGEVERGEAGTTDWKKVESQVLRVETAFREREENRLAEDRAVEETRRIEDRLLAERRAKEDSDNARAPSQQTVDERAREDVRIVTDRLKEDIRNGAPDSETLRQRAEEDRALANARREEDRRPGPFVAQARPQEDEAVEERRQGDDLRTATRRKGMDELRKGLLERAASGKRIPDYILITDQMALETAVLRRNKAAEQLNRSAQASQPVKNNEPAMAMDPIAANRKVQDLHLLEDEVIEAKRKVEDLRREVAGAHSSAPDGRHQAENHAIHNERGIEDRKRNGSRREFAAAWEAARRRGDPINIDWVAEKEERFRDRLRTLNAEKATLTREREGVGLTDLHPPLRELPMKEVLSQAFDLLRADTSPRVPGRVDRIKIPLRTVSFGSKEDALAVKEAREAIQQERAQLTGRARLYDRFARHPDLEKFLDRIGPDSETAKLAFQEREGNRVDRENLLREVDGRSGRAAVAVREDAYGRGTWDKHVPISSSHSIEIERKAMAIERFELLPKDVRLGVLKMTEDRERILTEIHKAKQHELKARGDLQSLRERYDNRSWTGRAADRVANLFTGKMDADLTRRAKLEKAFSKPLPSERMAEAGRDFLRADPECARMLDKLAEKSRQGEFDRNAPMPIIGRHAFETRSVGEVGRLYVLERDLFTNVYKEKHWHRDVQATDSRAQKPPSQEIVDRPGQRAPAHDALADLDSMIRKPEAAVGGSQGSQKDRAQAEARGALQRQQEIDSRDRARQVERSRTDGSR